MLLKNENQIIRVLKSHGNKALVIDCIKKTMPKWVDGNSLSNFDDCGEDEMFERTDYPFGRELTPKEERIAQERFTMISSYFLSTFLSHFSYPPVILFRLFHN